MKTFTFSQLHEIQYVTTVTAETEADARALVQSGETDWDTDYDTCVEAGEVILEEVR